MALNGNTFETISSNKNIVLLGYFNCMGKISSPIAKFVNDKIIQNEEEWKEYIQEVMKHPDEIDKLNVRKFANNILIKAKN